MKIVLNDLSPERWMQLVAAALTGLLLLLLLVGWIWTLRFPPSPVVSPDPKALQAQALTVPEREFAEPLASIATDSKNTEESTDSELLPETVVESITERPLFWPTRRPGEEGQLDAQPESAVSNRRDDFDQVKLEGVYFAGDSSGIMVSVKGEKQRLRLNEELLGWTLVTLSASDAVFSRGESEHRSLQLEHALPAKYTAAASSRTRSTPAAVEPETDQ